MYLPIAASSRDAFVQHSQSPTDARFTSVVPVENIEEQHDNEYLPTVAYAAGASVQRAHSETDAWLPLVSLVEDIEESEGEEHPPTTSSPTKAFGEHTHGLGETQPISDGGSMSEEPVTVTHHPQIQPQEEPRGPRRSQRERMPSTKFGGLAALSNHLSSCSFALNAPISCFDRRYRGRSISYPTR
jgi:hypothetical protein